VLALLLRFYDPQQGAVRIGGTDVREYDPAALRRLIAVVPQDPVIFAASVLDNVRYGGPRRAARKPSAPASRPSRWNSSTACRRAWTPCSASAA
jgi:ATP-binding cassette subfamily B protein